MPQGAQGDLFATDAGFPGVGSPGVGFPGDKRTLSKNTSPNGEAADAAPVAEPVKIDAAKAVADAVWKHTQGMGNFMAVRAVAAKGLKLEGQTVESVTAALCAIYDDGKPMTAAVLGQTLTGAAGRRGWDRTTRADKSAHADHWAQPGAAFQEARP